jgi:hypothetical protein
VVRLKHIARNQDGTVVCEVERVVLFLRRQTAEEEGAMQDEGSDAAG